MFAVLKKELKSYFLSPIGYVFIGLFLLMTSVFFYLDILSYGMSKFQNMFYSLATILTFITPILTMRMFSEEKKEGTDQLLFTSPRGITSIVFGKFLNCGQTCVAPDYIYCDRTVKDKLIKELKKQIQKQYSKQPLAHKEYGKIINLKHFDRLLGLIDYDKVVYGGTFDHHTLQIEPTIMDNVTFSDAVMQEEIFGPVLPILTYDSINEAVNNIHAMPHPLALYIFAGDTHVAENVIARIGFGGGCINDTLIHLATSEMPFGGFGESGMGSYHGKTGFDTFTHYKSIVDKKTWLDLPIRYQPYKKINNKLLHMFLK